MDSLSPLKRTSSENSTESQLGSPPPYSEISSPDGSPTSLQFDNVSTPPYSPIQLDEEELRQQEPEYNGQDAEVNQLLEDLPRLIGDGEDPQELKQKFVRRMGQLFGRIERASEIFQRYVKAIVDRYSEPEPRSETGNRIHDPNLLALVVEVLIIFLEFLPFLLHHAFVIVDYTLGSLVNFSTVGIFNNTTDNKKVHTICSAIGNILFVKMTTIISNIVIQLLTGMFILTYSSRLLCNYFILLTLFYFLGALSRHHAILAPIIHLFFNVTINIANLLLFPFDRVWLIPVDCGLEGAICIIPYDFRDLVMEPIRDAKDKYDETVGQINAMKEDFVNASKDIWNTTTSFAASTIMYLPTISKQLFENMTESMVTNEDTFRELATNAVEQYVREPIHDTTTSVIEGVVSMVTVFGEKAVALHQSAEISSIKSMILTNMFIDKETLDEMDYDELNELLELLLSPVVITAEAERFWVEGDNPLSGPRNRLMFTGTTQPKANHEYVPNVVVDFTPRHVNLNDNVFIRETKKVRVDGLGRRIETTGDDDIFIKNFIGSADSIQKRPIASITRNRVTNVNKGRSSTDTSYQRKDTIEEAPSSKGSSKRPIQLLNSNKPAEVTPFEIEQLKTTSMSDSRAVQENYAHFFGRRGDDENTFRMIPDFKLNNVNEIFDKSLAELKLNIDTAIESIVRVPSIVRESSSRALAFSVYTLTTSSGPLIVDVKSILRQLNTPESEVYRRVFAEDVTNVLTDVTKFSGEVTLNIATQMIIQKTTDHASYYVVTPSVNYVFNMVVGIATFLFSSGVRRIRGGRHKKSMKRRSRNKKSTKKHRKHKKSSKKYRKHKKSTKKHRKHKKSSKK